MNAVMTISRQTKRMAGLAALAATLFTTAGTLGLAEHYAHTGRAAQDFAAANPAAGQAAPAVSRHAENAQAATRS